MSLLSLPQRKQLFKVYFCHNGRVSWILSCSYFIFPLTGMHWLCNNIKIHTKIIFVKVLHFEYQRNQNSPLLSVNCNFLLRGMMWGKFYFIYYLSCKQAMFIISQGKKSKIPSKMVYISIFQGLLSNLNNTFKE